MRDWYTNAEIAALDLPGFPATEAGVSYWLKQKDLDARFPNKVRRRKGRGGGVERHVTMLPRSLQSLIAVREVKTVAAGAVPVVQEAPPSGERAVLRRDAILSLLSLWDVFRARRSGSVETSRHLFVAMYGNGKLENLPDWVREALTSGTGKRKGISVNTLRNWEKRRDQGDFAGLSGQYGNRRGKGVLDIAHNGEVATFIVARILEKPWFTADHIRDDVRVEYGNELLRSDTGEIVPLPDVRTFQRWIGKWKAEHKVALERETNPDGFKSKYRASGTDMNHWVTRPNMLWEIDASPTDILLRDGRYSLYTVTDIWTRRMMATISKTATTEGALSLVRRAILDWGVPGILRTDNGADFKSHRFVSAILSLGIDPDVTAAFSPEQKGTVERGIGTIQRGLMPRYDSFIGHDVADRKKIEARKAFAERLGVRDDKADLIDLEPEKFQDDLDRWLESKYAHKKHRDLGCSPFEKLASYTGAIKRLENPRALDLLLAPIVGQDGRRVIGKQGIAYDKTFFVHPDLRVGDQVFCRIDPSDMGRLYVYTADALQFLCVAISPKRLGVDGGEVTRLRRQRQKEMLDADLAEAKAHKRRLKDRDFIDEVLAMHERESASLTAFPKPLRALLHPGTERCH